MANIQKQFENFHNAIMLDNENDVLREKREIILDRLKSKIPEEAKSYTTFNQGSYAMFTGIKPINGEYDIDVGVSFFMSKDEVLSLTAKNWVYEALVEHTDDVRIKTPCITVTYKKNGVPSYHVDLAVYAVSNSDSKKYLAKGKTYSKEENKKWEISDPKDLITKIRDHLSDADDRKQFRRIIRYLKRWKDLHFTKDDSSKPTGIALTVAAYYWLNVSKTCVDFFANKYKYDDLECLINLITSMSNKFIVHYDQEFNELYRLTVTLPVEPFGDLFEKMTDKQMTDFKVKLDDLLLVMKAAKDEVDPVEACEKVQKVFGEDFEVPLPEDTARAKSVAVTTTSSSARI